MATKNKKIISNSLESEKDINKFSMDIEDLCASINKKIKGQGGAFILGKGESPTEIPFFVPTGSTILDTIITNKIGGGIPIGRIVEIWGEPSTGKSLLANHILAETQKLGGLPILIDTESATSPDFLNTIGVDVNKLLWVQVQTVEEIFSVIENTIQQAIEKKPKFITIVWDSIAGTSDDVEMEQEFESQGYGMQKAKLMSKGFRKLTQLISRNNIALVCTNQVRSNIGVTFGEKCVDPFTTKIKIRYKV